ncbi:hypothetical protein BCS95_11805 [Vibrio breoganii]|nr:hypothetical protein A1QE_15865 [Vibrio breoganii ZF-55]PMP02160.1 hypothetical protein BCS95_11805 [Vibrio breoganii]
MKSIVLVIVGIALGVGITIGMSNIFIITSVDIGWGLTQQMRTNTLTGDSCILAINKFQKDTLSPEDKVCK